MIEVSVTEFARNLRTYFDQLEHHRDEIVLIRNNHRIARIIPGSSRMGALEAMGDLYSTLSEEAGEDWLTESRLPASISEEVSNPWDT